ncbi:MAG: hypothetical protein FD164_797 [Nitrospirae bacterium]|nr:MAG: hypothetical protein FD164_797 [Nitrospirota bacterium]
MKKDMGSRGMKVEVGVMVVYAGDICSRKY